MYSDFYSIFFHLICKSLLQPDRLCALISRCRQFCFGAKGVTDLAPDEELIAQLRQTVCYAMNALLSQDLTNILCIHALTVLCTLQLLHIF